MITHVPGDRAARLYLPIPFPTRAVVLGAGIASIRCRVHMECHLLASRVPGVSSG